MLVLVAIKTLGESEPVERLSTFWHMALCAIDGSVLQQQGIGGRRMFFNSVRCRLETLHHVTGSTLTFVGAFHELPVVLILVTVQASLKRQRLLEITPGVALEAIYALVLALQRVLGFRVIESLVDSLQ